LTRGRAKLGEKWKKQWEKLCVKRKNGGEEGVIYTMPKKKVILRNPLVEESAKEATGGIVGTEREKAGGS